MDFNNQAILVAVFHHKGVLIWTLKRYRTPLTSDNPTLGKLKILQPRKNRWRRGRHRQHQLHKQSWKLSVGQT